MYNVPKFVPKVYLVRISGERWKFKNLEQAAKELYKLGYFTFWSSYIGDSFEKIWTWSEISYTQAHYIVRTEIGDVITVDELREIIRKPRRKWWIRWDYNPEKDFRNGPLRSIHRYGRWCGYRYPKTTQERRIAEAHEKDEDLKYYGVKVRARRNSKNIPNAYDDISRSNNQQKNWKRYRKTQYKRKR